MIRIPAATYQRVAKPRKTGICNGTPTPALDGGNECRLRLRGGSLPKKALSTVAYALVFLLACLLAGEAAAAPVRITDDGGEDIVLAAPAARIIPLYAPFSDMLAAMGEEARIVARTKSDTRSALAPTLPVIGTHMRPNLESILARKPDLVLQMGSRADAAKSVADLRRHGIPTAFFHIRSFAGLFSTIERLGILTDRQEAAAALVSSLQTRLEALRQTLEKAKASPVPVFFEIRYPNLLGAGPESLVTDIIRAAGGTNVLAGEASSRSGTIVRLSEEELLRLNPAVYCVQSGPMNKNPLPPDQRPHFATLQAVRTGRVFFVDEFLFSRPGPGAVDAAETLARLLHPHLFPPSPAVPGQENTR